MNTRYLLLIYEPITWGREQGSRKRATPAAHFTEYRGNIENATAITWVLKIGMTRLNPSTLRICKSVKNCWQCFKIDKDPELLKLYYTSIHTSLFRDIREHVNEKGGSMTKADIKLDKSSTHQL